MRPALQRFTALWLPRIEAELDRILPRAEQAPEVLHAAMRYALVPGGKRLRPVLALLGTLATGGDPERALCAACAVELLHTYSLVHDDLPCMDDDDLRRGRPTCHLVYGEAVAVLVGDALLTLALELAAEGGADAVRALARAAGSLGMVGGQAADVLAERAPEKGPRDEAKVRWIHERKTAALITAALEVGARAGVPDRRRLPRRDRDATAAREGDREGRRREQADLPLGARTRAQPRGGARGGGSRDAVGASDPRRAAARRHAGLGPRAAGRCGLPFRCQELLSERQPST
jgi:hypothetical protein